MCFLVYHVVLTWSRVGGIRDRFFDVVSPYNHLYRRGLSEFLDVCKRRTPWC